MPPSTDTDTTEHLNDTVTGAEATEKPTDTGDDLGDGSEEGDDEGDE